MKLKEHLKVGTVEVVPEDSDDLYVLYNIITEGDRIIAKTSRKVKKGTSGSETTTRITTTIELVVISTEFHGFGESIRVKGTIASAGDESVSLGSHHSIAIELKKPVSIIKDSWSRSELEELRESQLGNPLGLIILVIDDDHALITQVGSHASKILLEIVPAVTRKGSDPNQYQQSLQDYFEEVLNFLRDLQKQGKIEQLVVGGPGFIHEKFMELLRKSLPNLIKQSLNVAIKSSGRPGIQEILNYHLPENFVEQNKGVRQAELVQEILDHLGRNTGLVAYAGDVVHAIEIGAVEKLLILDKELHKSPEERNKINRLMDDARTMRGFVSIMSSMHDNGKIIEGLGSIVAILRFPIPK
ncbi:MAG: mRNA surveillance protein pelota [Candidatus Heimdallarchaeota archaeon]|nr:mRNA surveillance protein pelota [Candidatus Heimdallarchaeota archaeon]